MTRKGGEPLIGITYDDETLEQTYERNEDFRTLGYPEGRRMTSVEFLAELGPLVDALDKKWRPIARAALLAEGETDTGEKTDEMLLAEKFGLDLPPNKAE